MLDNYFEEKVRIKLANLMICEINDLSDKVFENAVVHSMIFGFSNTIKNSNYNVKVNITDNPYKEFIYIPCSFFKGEPQCSFSIRSYNSNDILVKLKQGSKRLYDILDIRQAIKTGNDKIYVVTNKVSNNYKPILRGKDVNRYRISDPMLFVNYGKHLACPRNPEIFEQPKILIREAGARITASYDEDNFYIMSSLYNAILRDSHFSLKYILGLICSSLFQYIMNKLTFEKTKGAFTKAKIFHYYELPVKDINKNQQQPIILLVDKILSQKKQNPQADTSALESEIDQLVYKLYDLTPEEIAIVENSTK